MKRYAAQVAFSVSESLSMAILASGESVRNESFYWQRIRLERHCTLAKRKGRVSQTHYKNSDGNPVHFEFIGVMDLLCLRALSVTKMRCGTISPSM